MSAIESVSTGFSGIGSFVQELRDDKTIKNRISPFMLKYKFRRIGFVAFSEQFRQAQRKLDLVGFEGNDVSGEATVTYQTKT